MKTWVQEVCKSIFGEMELNTFLGSPTYNKYQNASIFFIWNLEMCFSGGSQNGRSPIQAQEVRNSTVFLIQFLWENRYQMQLHVISNMIMNPNCLI